MSDSVKQLRTISAIQRKCSKEPHASESASKHEDCHDVLAAVVGDTCFEFIADELEALRTENAKLRSDLSHIASDAGRDSCAAIAKGNAELRAAANDTKCTERKDGG